MRETLTVALFIIGNLIGAGFFMMPASVAAIGSNLVWSWLAGATIAFSFALIFGKLFVFFPNSETLCDYFENFSLKQTVAILYWVGAIVGNVVLLVMTVAALKPQSFLVSLLGAFFVMLILTLINHCFTYETVQFIEIILSVLKFSLLIFLPMLIFISDPLAIKIPPATGGFAEITRLGALSFWAFLGIETAGVFGKGRSAKNGLLIGVVACFLLYVFSCFLIVGVVPLDLLSAGKEIPLVLLIQRSKFPFLAEYVSFLISFTCFGALYGWVAATSKMSLSYANAGVFHHFFLNATKSDTSILGLWLSSCITFLIFLLVGGFQVSQQFEIIADFCVNITLFIFWLCAFVLMFKSNRVFDKFLSVFGMFFVGFLLAMNFYSSLVSLVLFLLTLISIKCLNQF